MSWRKKFVEWLLIYAKACQEIPQIPAFYPFNVIVFMKSLANCHHTLLEKIDNANPNHQFFINREHIQL